MKAEKIFIKGNSAKGKDIIDELVQQGAKSSLALCGDGKSSYYYYIDRKGNIRITDDYDLLDDAGYKEISVSPSDYIFPFTSNDEMEEACKVHGYKVRNKCGCSLFDINRIMSLIGSYHSEQERYKHLAEHYEFEDGTPCGVISNK